MKNEKLTRQEIIDNRLKQAGWNVSDRTQVAEEFDIIIDSQQAHYFNNTVILPTGTYTYVPLYRLIAATGRELTSLTAPSHSDFQNDIAVPNPNTESNAMQTFSHSYTYDEIGNILTDNWKDYVYDDDNTNNRLLKHIQNQTLDDYTYDLHGNMLTMPHLSSMVWDFADRLQSAGNGTFTSYYNYDSTGNRSRKIVEKSNIREERYYLGGYEVFRKYLNGDLDLERQTLHIDDDKKKVAFIETKTLEDATPCSPSVVEVRYQYDNHLGSACLELDENADIISYEEYHPFGTTSYRSGRTETEVSLKRYKYVGKEKDEETGLYYYGARYYAAWICRFISVDPLQHDYPQLTPYNYAGNKPITHYDIDGMQSNGGDYNIKGSILFNQNQLKSNNLNPPPATIVQPSPNQTVTTNKANFVDQNKKITPQTSATTPPTELIGIECVEKITWIDKIKYQVKNALKNVISFIDKSEAKIRGAYTYVQNFGYHLYSKIAGGDNENAKASSTSDVQRIEVDKLLLLISNGAPGTKDYGNGSKNWAELTSKLGEIYSIVIEGKDFESDTNLNASQNIKFVDVPDSIDWAVTPGDGSNKGDTLSWSRTSIKTGEPSKNTNIKMKPENLLDNVVKRQMKIKEPK